MASPLFSLLQLRMRVGPYGPGSPNPLGDVLNVKDFGALGNGSHDDTSAIQSCFDAAWGSVSSPHGREAYNTPVFFPAGEYITTSPLVCSSVWSPMIVGCGKRASRIKNTTTGSTVFKTDGFQFGLIADMGFVSVGGSGSVCFDWRKTTFGALQVTNADLCVLNCAFVGAEIGVQMGAGTDGFGAGPDQASESQWVSCDFIDCSVNGIKGCNLNCLNHSIIGGSVVNCGDVGIMGNAGSFPLIYNVEFSGNVTSDIQHTIGNSSDIISCYSTSKYFANIAYGPLRVIGCYHNGTAGGYLTRIFGKVIAENNHSVNGGVEAYGGVGYTYLRGARFGTAGYAAGHPTSAGYLLNDVGTDVF